MLPLKALKCQNLKLLNRILLNKSILRLASTSTSNEIKLIPFSSINKEDLGSSILHRKCHTGETSATDTLEFGVKCAKFCSLGSSFAGLCMIPVLTNQIASGAAEKPALMTFLLISNAFLGVLALTPFLLQSLARRFISDVYYNPNTEQFTTVHYNFFLQKKALRFRAEDVVVAEKSPQMNKLWIPLATCFVDKHPLLLLLDPVQYSNQEAYFKLTQNIPPAPSQ